VAAAIAPYVEAGARHVNLIPVQDSAEETTLVAKAVQDELQKLFPAGV
jgi:hypothetical protein